MSGRVAALYVQADGCYAGLPDVDCWPEERDARRYTGPHPVVAHPPCTRWSYYWHGSPRKPHQHRLGEDAGCFAAALTAVRNYGGVLEHPAHSKAWAFFGLWAPHKRDAWTAADDFGGWTCHVEQRHYGHVSRKPTWLYAVAVDLPDLRWGRSTWSPDPAEVARIGYRPAQRNGALSRPGLRDRAKLRSATPPEFRDVLLAMARSVHQQCEAA